ncbi:MAG TPA: hypothetical protein VIU93_03990 [Gallionellaceae bacterium]
MKNRKDAILRESAKARASSACPFALSLSKRELCHSGFSIRWALMPLPAGAILSDSEPPLGCRAWQQSELGKFFKVH